MHKELTPRKLCVHSYEDEQLLASETADSVLIELPTSYGSLDITITADGRIMLIDCAGDGSILRTIEGSVHTLVPKEKPDAGWEEAMNELSVARQTAAEALRGTDGDAANG